MQNGAPSRTTSDHSSSVRRLRKNPVTLDSHCSVAVPRGEVEPRPADVRSEGTRMTDRTALFEAALDSYPEGIALLGETGQVVFWNRAAESMTGFAGMEMVARPIPWALEPLLRGDGPLEEVEPRAGLRGGLLAHAQHKLGTALPVTLRTLVLRDDLGERIGKAVVFHPAESIDSRPRGEASEDSNLEATQAKLEERMEAVFEDFIRKGAPLGLLWITVDQSFELRKTHGARASEAMLERVERTLADALRPSEELGRWGDDEFLVLAHERNVNALAAHAQVLAGRARTTDFRWWGDRISLTVSIGAAQAEPREGLVQLLERAQSAMYSSIHAGGNHVTPAPGRPECLPS
jgi:diguanylate cyclase (GGDEF)-like protein/PAS domain S-box-containing protein